MDKFGRIYKITNNINNKVYIGQTTMSTKLRFQNHISSCRRGKNNCYKLYRAFRKYGFENFSVETLEECLASELNEREKYWIEFYDSTKFGYNVSIGGNVTRTSKKLDENEVIRLFNEGNAATKIARMLHVNTYKISDILRKHNVVFGQEKQKISDTIHEEIVNLYSKGYGSYKIGKILGINKSTILRYLRKVGLIRTFDETIKARNRLL